MEMAPIYLQETRGGKNVQHELVPRAMTDKNGLTAN